MPTDPRKQIILLSLVASAVMLTGKLAAYFLTHSAAIFSDAAESVVHGAATGLAAYSLWYATRPPDSGHPYGHGRIAYFSAGFEGALVLAASVAIIWSGVRDLLDQPELRNLGWGLAITAVLAAINLVLGLTLIRVGRRHNSLILVANGKHVLSDMWTSAAAILGVGLVWATGVRWLDPGAALLIGVYIMLSGLQLLRTAFSGLMDEADAELSKPLVDGLEQARKQNRIEGFHQLRCRRINDEIWADVHVLVPGEWPTTQAHESITAVEESLRARFPQDTLHVTTHVEPADHAAAHPAGHPETGADPLKAD